MAHDRAGPARRKKKRGGWTQDGVKVREKVKGCGIWWVFVNRAGQRKSYRKGDQDTAEAFANELRAGFKLVEARQRGLTIDELQRIGLAQSAAPQPERDITFGEYAARCIDRWEPRERDPEHGLKFSTWRDYKGVLNARLIPELGTRPLGSLTRRDVKALRDSLRTKGLSAVNVRKHLRILSSVLSEAVDEELLQVNPALGGGRRRRRSKEKQVRRQQDPFTHDELATLFTTAETYSVERRGKTVRPFEPFTPFLLCLADTGLRLGEAIALRWGDVDWRVGLLLVQRSYSHGKLDVPKGGKPRKVELTTRLRSTLRAIYDRRYQRVAALNAGQQAALEAAQANTAAEALVFPDLEGGFLDADNVRARVWIPLLTEAKLRHRRLHDLRHTFATLHLQAGTDPIWVSAQLGHHSVAFTLSTYAHLPLSDRGGHADRIVAPKCTRNAPSTADSSVGEGAGNEKAVEDQRLSGARPG